MTYERNERDIQSAHQWDSLAVEAASQKWSVVKSASVPGCKESQFYSLPFGQAVASMY